MLRESTGPDKALDIPGLALASGGLLGIVWGLIHGNGDGWTSPSIVGALLVGAALLAAFVAWELRTPQPMLPMRFFRNRAFAAANGASLLMYFGMFGSIFLLSQFFQTAQGYSPLGAGLRILPWTLMPMFVAPVAGALSDRIGGRPLMATGLALQAVGLAWIAAVSTATVAYTSLVGPFIVSGIGMALFFAPVANVVLSAVRPRRKARRPEPTTRSARSVAFSVSPCWRRSSRVTAATSHPRRSSTGSSPRSGSGPLFSVRARSSRCSSRASGVLTRFPSLTTTASSSPNSKRPRASNEEETKS